MAARPNARRPATLQAAHWAYTKKFRWLTRCIYCGMDSTELDHVFPVSLASGLALGRPGVRKTLGQGLNCVPSCRDCNSLAGSNPFTSIRAKRDFIQEKLRKRLAADLRLPDWSPRELDEMGRTMRLHCEQAVRARLRASMRCNWPHIRGG